MSLLDRARARYTDIRLAPQTRAAFAEGAGRALRAGRPTDDIGTISTRWQLYDILERPHRYSTDLRRGRDTAETVRNLRDLHPDVSKAYANFQRHVNRGLTLTAYKLQFDDEANPAEDRATQAWVDEFGRRCGQDYGGGIVQLVNVMVPTMISPPGAIALEVGATEDLRDVTDFYLVEPGLVDLQRKDGRLVPVMQAQSGEWVELSPEQFHYLPFDPTIDSPHGRSPILAALSTVFFQAQVMADLQRVIRKGYARIDAKVLSEIFLSNLPPEIKRDPVKTAEFVSAELTALQATINTLEPDSVWVHSDAVEVSGVAVGAPSIDLKVVFSALDTQIVSALKQLPVLLGRNEGATTTHATVQWEIFAGDIEAMQFVIKNVLERAFATALRIKGIESRVEATFTKPRTTDRVQEATARQIEQATLLEALGAKLVDRDYVATQMYGKQAEEGGDETGPEAGPEGLLLKPQEVSA